MVSHQYGMSRLFVKAITCLNHSPRHSHNRYAVRDIFCIDCASADGDIVADGNRSEDGGTGTDVAVVANRNLPISKVGAFLTYENHRENGTISSNLCATENVAKSIMDKMASRTDVIG